MARLCGLFILAHAAVFFGSLALLWRPVGRRAPKLAVPQLASSSMAGAHGLAITIVAGAVLWEWDWATFDGPNTAHQELALLYTAAYFIADCVVYLGPYYSPGDWIYFAHHMVTLLFIGTALHLGRGAVPVTFGMFAGELTNPLFHGYLILEQFAATSTTAAAVFRWWAAAFTSVFLLVRTVLGPLAAIWYTRLALAHAEVPLAHRAIWCFTAWCVTLASQGFSHGFVTATLRLWREHLGAAAGRAADRLQHVCEAAAAAAHAPAKQRPAAADSVEELGGLTPTQGPAATARKKEA